MALINKMDIYGPEHRDVESLLKALDRLGVESFPISALTGEGLEEAKRAMREKSDSG
jgi:hypothetical protein